MNQTIVLICLVLIVFSALACAMFRSMLKAAISLAIVSALLSIVLFSMGATWAALFELSVCAGLVTVVFASAISLTSTSRHEPEKETEHRRRFAGLPFILIFAGMALIAVIVITGFHIEPVAVEPVAAASFKEIFWNTRQADILGQIIVILAGAFAVAILFKEGNKA